MLKEQASHHDKRGHNLTNCLNAWLHNQIAKKEKENKNNVLNISYDNKVNIKTICCK